MGWSANRLARSEFDVSNFNVPYLVGDTYKRDHQLWPTITRAELLVLMGGDNPVNNRAIELMYPIGVDLATIQVMVLRAREWQIDGAGFSSSFGAYFAPVIDQTDIATINVGGSTPAFSFRIQRYDAFPSSAVRDVTDERDFLAEWRDFTLTKDFVPPARTVPLWKTLRNLAVSQGFSNGIDNDSIVAAANPEAISSGYSFTEPYDHGKFGESGSGIGGLMVFYMLAGYILFDTSTGLFYPQMFFSFGGARLPFQQASRPGFLFQLLPADPIVIPTPPDIPCGFLTITFGGTGAGEVNVPIGHIFEDPPVPVPGGLTIPPQSGGLDLSMAPTKYWKFKNSLDQDVYDENDGHQVNDPFA